MKGSIAIVSGSHLCHNPRVLKEAITLAAAGYEVEVLGGWFDRKFKARDQELLSRLDISFTPVLDLVQNDGASRFVARLQRKLGEVAQVTGGLENTWQLGMFATALRQAANRSRADLLIAHSESGMAAVEKASSRRACRVAVDMEDWFSEDGTAEIRGSRPLRLLRSLERTLLNMGAYSSCTSKVLSDALAAEYGCVPPVVVYNAFAWSERKLLDGEVRDRRNPQLPSIHWFSQSVGAARGLEDLFAALPYVNHEAEIHLRGQATPGLDRWISDQAPAEWRARIFIHELVTNDELLSRIAEHDIGFAGEGKYCRNKDLTVSNKILQYLLAGLAVVASDTEGQREVAGQAKRAVRIYRSGDPKSLAAKLNSLLGSAEKLRIAKVAALAAAEKTFCWERQAPVLLQTVEQALVG